MTPDGWIARNMAHAAFDQLWRRGYMSRDAAYAWLAWQFGLMPDQAHIASLSVEQCMRLVGLAHRELARHVATSRRSLRVTLGDMAKAKMQR